MNNGCTGQVIGPFVANEEIYDIIKENCIEKILYVKHIGIQIDDMQNQVKWVNHPTVFINGKEYEIGKTGILELINTEITSIYFPIDRNENTIIDYSIEISE